MKLFVDDDVHNPDATNRHAPEGWDTATSYDEAKDKLTKNRYDEVSLDHDLASYDKNGRERTGYDLALWLATRKHAFGDYIPPVIKCHSANPVGRQRIQGIIDRYLK